MSVLYQLVPGKKTSALFNLLLKNLDSETGGLAYDVCQGEIQTSYLKNHFAQNRSTSFSIIASVRNKLVGFCEAKIYVRPDGRKVVHLALICTHKGHGKGLMTRFINYCRNDIQAHVIVLEAVDERAGFYAHLGFERSPDACRPLVGHPAPARGVSNVYKKALAAAYYPKPQYENLGGYNKEEDTVVMSMCLTPSRGVVRKSAALVDGTGRLLNSTRYLSNTKNRNLKRASATNVSVRTRKRRSLWGVD